MEFIDLLIYSSDSDYSLALGEGLSSHKNNFIITVCKAESGLPDVSSFDLMLIDSDSPDINERFKDDKRVIRLTDSRSGVLKNIELMSFVLYKYSGLLELSADILLYYSLLSGKRNFSWSEMGPKIIVFCSGKGGVGKTTVAFGTAQVLRRYYTKSVLYVSLEEFESTLRYIEGREGGFGLCEYLYYLFRPEGVKPDAGAFMISDKFGVEAFMPDKGRNRLRELDGEEMASFFTEIAENRAYDYILVDTGECFCEAFKWIFSVCHKTAAVLSAEEDVNERERRFVDYLRFASEKEPLIIYNKFDGDSIETSGNVTNVSIDFDFGTRIKEFVKKIL